MSLSSGKCFEFLLEDKEFHGLKTYRQRIAYVLTKVIGFEQFREEVFVTADTHRSDHSKNINLCLSHQTEGENYFQRKEYQSSIQCFTNAILSAPITPDSKELCLCYAMRSLVFFELGSYEESLFDANQSLLLSKSVEMVCLKIRCLSVLERLDEMNRIIDEYIHLFDDKQLKELADVVDNSLITKNLSVKTDDTSDGCDAMSDLWIHPNIKIETCKEKGRYMRAVDFIEANTAILKEKPTNVVYYGENVLKYCNYCHQHIGDQFYPCLQCIEIVYCGQKCRQKAFIDYHRYECGIVGYLFGLYSNSLQVFRLFVQIGCRSVVDCHSQVTQKGFDVRQYIKQEMDTSDRYEDSERMADKFKFVSTLVEHSDKQTNLEQILFNTFCAIEITLLLNYSTALDSEFIKDLDSFVSFADIVCRYTNRIAVNVFGWFDDQMEDKRVHVSNILMLCSSLINHSCDPNINYFFGQKLLHFETNRDIKPNEEINISYGTLESNPLIERQNKLKSSYHFECDCKACRRSVRTVSSLKCLHCDGPVIYDSTTDPNNCFDCKHVYENPKQALDKLDIYSEHFGELLSNYCKDQSEELSLEMAESALKTNIKILYKLSPNLLSQIRQFVVVCLHFSQTEKAMKLSKHLMPSIDFDLTERPMISAQVVNDLFLLTKVHRRYLTENSVQDIEQWKVGLNIYSKVIEFNRKVKINQNITNGSVNKLFKSCIKQFKEEFRDLTEIYDRLVASSAVEEPVIDSGLESAVQSIDLESDRSVVVTTEKLNEKLIEAQSKEFSDPKSDDIESEEIFSSSQSEPSVISYDSTVSISFD